MKITDDGQVTIPEDIRKRCGLVPGSEVEFEVVGDAVQLKKKDVAPLSRGEALVAHLRGRGTSGMTTDEIMALTRGED